MDSKTFRTVVGSFLKILRIQILVLFLDCSSWFYGLLFVNWEIYGMLLCSYYCDTMPMGVPFWW